MNRALATTLKTLAESANEATVAVLTAALDGPHEDLRQGALAALLDCRHAAAQRELLRRWPQLSAARREMIANRPGRLSSEVRAAVVSLDPDYCRIGCDAVLSLREYDLIPALVNAAETPSNPNDGLAASTLLELAHLLYQELAAPRDYARRRDPQLVRRHVVGSLEASLERFERHRRRETVEAFLLLAARDNALLRKVLHNPHDAAYLTVLDVLAHGEQAGVMRLLLSFLDDPQAPTAALHVLARRCDPPFVNHLLRKIGFEPSAAAKCNLRRLDAIAWARPTSPLLEQLDENAQHAALQMVLASNMNRLDAFDVVQRLLRGGRPGGRKSAAIALASFRGAEANRLALEAMNDPDPQVQAAIVAQLRERGLPGALGRLIECLDSPHEAIRQAARSALGEFSFRRFLAAFDTLEEAVRQSTGALVRKVDRECLALFSAELASPARSRRLRALELAPHLGLDEPVIAAVSAALADEDHMIRAAAVAVLGQSQAPLARSLLCEALGDRSTVVQEAAAQALEQWSDATRWRQRPAAASAPTHWEHLLGGFASLANAPLVGDATP